MQHLLLLHSGLAADLLLPLVVALHVVLLADLLYPLVVALLFVAAGAFLPVSFSVPLAADAAPLAGATAPLAAVALPLAAGVLPATVLCFSLQQLSQVLSYQLHLIVACRFHH